MNTVDLLEYQASARPDQPAIIDRNGKSITFAQLRDASARFATLLRRHRIGAGDRVVLLMPIASPMYVALLGILWSGAVATVFDPSAGLDHIRHCCERARPAAMVGIPKAHLLRFTSSAVRSIPHKFCWGMWLPGAIRCDALDHLATSGIEPVSPESPALMTFTSGSTGRPKAAVRSHALLAAQGAAVRAAMELAPGEIALTTLPVFTLANLAAGVSTLIADADLASPGRIDPLPVLRQIERHRPQSAVASPAFFERLLSADTGREALRHFRRIYTGGAPVYPSLMRRLAAAAPDAQIVAVYGSTEAEPIAHVALSEISAPDFANMTSGGGLLAGPAVPEIALRILPNTFGRPIAAMSEEDFAARVLSPEQAGEIVVSGDHVLKGYLDGVGNETTKFTVGQTIWHRTGDAGRVDDRGRLWLLGRAEAVIRDARGELFPFAVEVAAGEIEGVARSALVAHEGRRVLVVECVHGVDRSIADRLKWAQLDEVLRIDAIPLDKRHNAKVDYPALRKLVSAGLRLIPSPGTPGEGWEGVRAAGNHLSRNIGLEEPPPQPSPGVPGEGEEASSR